MREWWRVLEGTNRIWLLWRLSFRVRACDLREFAVGLSLVCVLRRVLVTGS